MTSARDFVSQLAIPALRAYLRYFPIEAGKATLWHSLVHPFFSWRHHQYEARTVFGSKMHGDAGDIIQGAIYYFGVWEPQLTHWITHSLGPHDTFIDVGANVGYFTLLASSLVGREGQVIAVEPFPANFEILACNVRLNRRDNIRLLNCAAWDKETLIGLQAPEAGNIGTARVSDTKGCVEVQAHRLCDLLPAEIQSAKVIKIDTEGAELSVLKGLVPILGNCRPDIQIITEVTPQNARRVFQMLGELGFQAYDLDNKGWGFFDQSPVVPRPLKSAPDQTTDIVFSKRRLEF